ncbi:MAG: phenylalanine--tRNA ligase subunit beta [Planctomycetes bacterium]|nr:phenylalanine--tRNA ligase subunit beta [Planctomycetota bacterium]
MLLSLRWLSRYVDLSDLDATRIADDLTMATAEVDGLEVSGEALREIVVGHVVECGKHPDADKLSLTKIDDGSGELLQVVCGAPNVAQGQRIAFCRVGVNVPVDGKKLKKGKIRGLESLGMICSARELGLSEDHTGILVLDTEAAPGTRLTDVLPLSDTLIEIDNKSVTHRPDLWGHYGFARELAAIYERPLKDALEGLSLDVPTRGDTVPIAIDASRGACSRYCGVVIRDVVIGPSPDWMQQLLVAIGARPRNNIVDLTNWLQFDLGQPTHAFDLDRLAGPRIDVRFANEGESITTLDGQARALTTSDLLICDGNGPVALAGVMGGEGSMVEEGTTSVLLESANFDAATVRRTSMRLGLRTDSSARFEKSLDPALAELTARKFLAMLPEVAPGARVAGPIVDPASWAYEPRHVHLRLPRVSSLLGVAIDESAARGFLEPLGFTLREKGYESFDVTIPSWRATKDIAIEEDLVEEIGRCFRYDAIEPVAPRAPVDALHRDPELALDERVRTVCAYDLGLHEVYNYSFLDDALCERLGLAGFSYVQVTNAIASHLSRVRRDVLPSLLGSVTDNFRSRDDVALFEVGNGYRPESPGEARAFSSADGDAHERVLPLEVHQLAALRVVRGGEHPYRRLRGDFETLLARLGVNAADVRVPTSEEASTLPWMHPARTAVFVTKAGEVLGYVGDVHPRTVRALDLDFAVRKGPTGGAAACCLDLRACLAAPVVALRYVPVPRFPSQPVDLAFLVDDAVRAGDVGRLIEDANPKFVRRHQLFEVYRGKGLPDGKKSLNFRVELGSDKRTLNAEDEERYLDRIRNLCRERGFELRG